MKRFLFILVILLVASTAYAKRVGIMQQALSGTGPETLTFSSINSQYNILEVRAKFSASVTTAADIVTIYIDSADGANNDMRLCAPDHDSDGTPSIGTNQYVSCMPVRPWVVKAGSAIVFTFTNTDSLNGEIEVVYSQN